MRVCKKILKAPKVGSCVACAFEGEDYVNLEAFWQFPRQNFAEADL